jgi:predicted nucleic acid-binding protein
LILLPYDSQAARQAVIINRQLRKDRTSIEIPDLFIAACAMVNNMVLATLNPNHFERVKGLGVLKA